MSDSVAKTRLKALTAWEAVPGLSDEEIDALLLQSQIVDLNGVSPGDSGYVPTYNLRVAAKEGWTWKMAKASEMVSSDMDGDRMSANQLFDQCQAMRRRFLGTGSPTVGPEIVESNDLSDIFFS